MSHFFNLLKNKLSHFSLFLVSPYLLAVYVWGVILLLSPHYFQKYEAKILESQNINPDYQTYYHDLDNDGISEKTHTLVNGGSDTPAVSFFRGDDKIINQWNLRGTWLTDQKLFFGDYNDNGYAEAYCITRVGDSLFLNARELLAVNGIALEDIFVSRSNMFDIDKVDAFVVDGKTIDINDDGFKEFVFTVFSGFSNQPRNTFAYDIHNKSLTKSPLSAVVFTSDVQYIDLNGDGIAEMTGCISAVNNIDRAMPYTDSCSWLMVLNLKDSLRFLFPPIRYNGKFGGIMPSFILVNERIYIAAIFNCNSDQYVTNGSVLQLYTTEGELLNEKLIPEKEYGGIQVINSIKGNDKYFYLIDSKGRIYTSDTLLNIKLFSEPNFEDLMINYRNMIKLDVDNDGEKELLMIATQQSTNKLIIYRSSLKESTIIDLPESNLILNYHVTLKESGNGMPPIIVFQAGNTIYYISYGKSNFYLLKYPAYLGLYFLLLLIFWGLQKAQNKLAQSRFETEKRLMHQQLAISKNQLEPHFMLNTLNSIGYMFANENQEKAQFYFGKFASLIRRGLTYADKTETSLKEELAFVHDYLVLQERRYSELCITIENKDDIDMESVKIPHSLIYTFAENALKHGLFHKTGAKNLDIEVISQDKKIAIIIKDNGIGRKRSSELKTMGTGKGLHIVTTIVESYNKLYNRSVSYKINDLLDEKGVGIGTEVRVLV